MLLEVVDADARISRSGVVRNADSTTTVAARMMRRLKLFTDRFLSGIAQTCDIGLRQNPARTAGRKLLRKFAELNTSAILQVGGMLRAS